MVVDHAVYEFLRSFLEALVIVLGVSFISLGWRTGIVVATSVPLVLAIVVLVMSTLAMDLNRITLGALIIALGLLVDDAIIAVEMMVVKMEQGWPRERAAAFAWTSTAFPMLTAELSSLRHRLCCQSALPSSAVGGICRRHFLGGGDRPDRVWLVDRCCSRLISECSCCRISEARPCTGPDAIYNARFYNHPAAHCVVRLCVRAGVSP